MGPLQVMPIGGGCINNTYRLSLGPKKEYFVKLNGSAGQQLFSAEAEGLNEIARTHSLRTPTPICHGLVEDQAFLAMEYVPLRIRGDQATAGAQLAQLHRNTQPAFGWHRDNHIGSTPQVNRMETDWSTFWKERRLAPQLSLAKHNGFEGVLQERGAELSEHLAKLLNHTPTASLLHGDLWSGNLAYDGRGQPVIYDPAVYYGDREADLAMTELFGGFSDRFYGAYKESWPLADGYNTRKQLYNLYHLLNHLNLFGSGYLGQAETLIDRLLAEVKA